MQDSILKFSEKESRLISDREFFHHKQSITKKIIELFSVLEQEFRREIAGKAIPEEITSLSGKIFRGENYRGYPYIMLDYPRRFQADSVLAIRTMFWWGHEFSFTLHLQGDLLEKYRSRVSERVSELNRDYYYGCTGETPWEYHFGEDNYQKLNDYLPEFKSAIQSAPFIKISRRVDVKDFGIVQETAIKSFKDFLRMIED